MIVPVSRHPEIGTIMIGHGHAQCGHAQRPIGKLVRVVEPGEDIHVVFEENGWPRRGPLEPVLGKTRYVVSINGGFRVHLAECWKVWDGTVPD